MLAAVILHQGEAALKIDAAFHFLTRCQRGFGVMEHRVVFFVRVINFNFIQKSRVAALSAAFGIENGIR